METIFLHTKLAEIKRILRLMYKGDSFSHNVILVFAICILFEE